MKMVAFHPTVEGAHRARGWVGALARRRASSWAANQREKARIRVTFIRVDSRKFAAGFFLAGIQFKSVDPDLRSTTPERHAYEGSAVPRLLEQFIRGGVDGGGAHCGSLLRVESRRPAVRPI